MTANVKFVDQLPPSRRGQNWSTNPVLSDLRNQPGRWAEVGRYEKRGSASSRGAQLASRHADIEYTTRRIGDEFVLFLRSVAA